MRVLMVTQAVDLDDPVLGFTHTWINALAHRVETLHVVALAAGRHHMADNVVLHAHGPPSASHNRLSRLWFLNERFARLILGNQIDAVFVHMIPHWVILSAPYAKICRVPIVLWYTHQAISWQLRLAHLLADRVVTASRESYPLWDKRKVVALGHGIDTEHFHPAPRQLDGFFRVLSVGRLSPVKQYEVLIEAARILVHEQGMDNLRVRIVGGPARPGDEEHARKLRQQVTTYGLEKHVEFAGAIPFDRIPSEYQGSDLFVSCQPTSMDKAVLEAMACGVPVVVRSAVFEPLLSGIVDDKLSVSHGDMGILTESITGIARLSQAERRILRQTLRERAEGEHSVAQLTNRLISALEIIAS